MGLSPAVKHKRFFYRPNATHIGIALAVIFGVVGVYSTFFKDTRPNLLYEIVISLIKKVRQG